MTPVRSSLGAVVLAALIASALTIQASAQEPAARVPEELREPVEGYTLAVPYQKWAQWIERQTGDALKIALSALPEIEGSRPIGKPFLDFAHHGDDGAYAMGDIRVFCPLDSDWLSDTESCHYLYRRAGLRPGAATLGSPDAPDLRWMRENFDPARVVAVLRAEGVAPGAELWPFPNAVLFAGHPSAVPMLVERVEMISIDSRQCLALHEAVRSLDKGRLTLRTDLWAVGDTRTPPPPMVIHGSRLSYTLQFGDHGRAVTLSGSGYGRDPLVAPLLEAADACAAERSAGG